MFCPNCQRAVPDGARACEVCGGAATVYGPPEGFLWDAERRLYYREERVAPGETEHWVTWFDPNSGEYSQLSYPVWPLPGAYQQAFYPAQAVQPPRKKGKGKILAIVLPLAFLLLAGAGLGAWWMGWLSAVPFLPPSPRAATAQSALELELNRAAYAPGEEILVEIRGLSREMFEGDLTIALYAEDGAEVESTVADGASASLSAPDEPGRYEVRLYFEARDEAYEAMATFTVEGQAATPTPKPTAEPEPTEEPLFIEGVLVEDDGFHDYTLTLGQDSYVSFYVMCASNYGPEYIEWRIGVEGEDGEILSLWNWNTDEGVVELGNDGDTARWTTDSTYLPAGEYTLTFNTAEYMFADEHNRSNGLEIDYYVELEIEEAE